MSSPTILSYRSLSLVLIVTLITLSSGCLATFGPQAIERTHPAYNEAIITSINEQVLQNMVRMRYRDVAFFLEIDSVTTSLSLEANAGVDGGLNFGGPDSLSPDLGLGYADSPTISYTPLEGENRLKRLLRPIESEAILMLTQSGWDIDRVLGLCFEQINELYNAPTASGPTPQREKDYGQFNKLLDALSALRERRLVKIGRKRGNKSIVLRLVADDAESKKQIRLIYELFQLEPNEVKDGINDFELRTDFLEATAAGEAAGDAEAAAAAAAAEAEAAVAGEAEAAAEEAKAAAAGKAAAAARARVKAEAAARVRVRAEAVAKEATGEAAAAAAAAAAAEEAKPLAVRIRSISSLLYYLSQYVEAPKQHQTAGLVTVTMSKTGDVFDWTKVPAARRFRVKTQTERPDNAYIATYYRGHWFYLEDTDLESKSTFMLLRELYDLQDGLDLQDGQTESRRPARSQRPARSRRPLLTLPLR